MLGWHFCDYYFSELAHRFEDISRQLHSIQRHLNQRPKSRPSNHLQSHERYTESSPRNDNRRDSFHGRFGDWARKCPPPCSSERGRRISVPYQGTKRGFLIGCGGEICCYPRDFRHDKRPYMSFELSAGNHSCIKTYGSLRLNIHPKNLRRNLPWNFVIADVAEPITGSDILAYYHLLPDCRCNQIIDATSLSSLGLRTPNLQRRIKVLAIEN